MEIIREGFGLVIGICAGAFVAAGVFALITFIGIMPRIIERGHCAKASHFFEWAIILGGSIGNVIALYWKEINQITKMPSTDMLLAGKTLVFIIGVGCGAFVGSLFMSLAESMKVLPVVCRKLRITIGMSWIIAAIGFGKGIGALLYYFMGW